MHHIPTMNTSEISLTRMDELGTLFAQYADAAESPTTPNIPVPPVPSGPRLPPVEVPAPPAFPDLPPEHKATMVAASTALSKPVVVTDPNPARMRYTAPRLA